MNFIRFKSNLKFIFSVYLKFRPAKILGAPRSAHRGALPVADALAPGADWTHVNTSNAT
jgi:hypothetical protein